MRYVRLKKMVQIKDTLNEKQSLPCWRLFHGPLFFLHRFLRFVLLLLLHHSGKIAIPHDHMFLLLHIMPIILFKSLQCQCKLRISVNILVFLWWARDGNLRLSFLRRSDIPFVRNLFVAISFGSIFERQFRKVLLLVLQQCGDD